MLVAISKYLKPLDEVDLHRAKHHQYLKPLFESKKLTRLLWRVLSNESSKFPGTFKLLFLYLDFLYFCHRRF